MQKYHPNWLVVGLWLIDLLKWRLTCTFLVIESIYTFKVVEKLQSVSLQDKSFGQFCCFHWTFKSKKTFSFMERHPQCSDPGLCPVPCWGMWLQIPVIGWPGLKIACSYSQCAVKITKWAVKEKTVQLLVITQLSQSHRQGLNWASMLRYAVPILLHACNNCCSIWYYICRQQKQSENKYIC